MCSSDLHIADLAARRPIVDFRFARIDADGRLRHFSINAKPLFDGNGDFAGYRGTGREITQIVNAEKFLRDIIDAVPAVIMVKDAESRYVMMNDYYARTVLGTTPAIGTGLISGAFLGEKAAQGIASVLGSGEGQSIIARLAKQAAAHGVDAGLQGAIMGLGGEASEEALGDSEQIGRAHV